MNLNITLVVGMLVFVLLSGCFDDDEAFEASQASEVTSDTFSNNTTVFPLMAIGVVPENSCVSYGPYSGVGNCGSGTERKELILGRVVDFKFEVSWEPVDDSTEQLEVHVLICYQEPCELKYGNYEVYDKKVGASPITMETSNKTLGYMLGVAVMGVGAPIYGDIALDIWPEQEFSVSGEVVLE